jgi:hypothetical protein
VGGEFPPSSLHWPLAVCQRKQQSVVRPFAHSSRAPESHVTESEAFVVKVVATRAIFADFRDFLQFPELRFPLRKE